MTDYLFALWDGGGAVPPVLSIASALAQRGHDVRVLADPVLRDEVEAAGVAAPYLCRGGVCGECETSVLELEGELIHNDHWLCEADRASGRKIMPCVSRARCTRLVIDR